MAPAGPERTHREDPPWREVAPPQMSPPSSPPPAAGGRAGDCGAARASPRPGASCRSVSDGQVSAGSAVPGSFAATLRSSSAGSVGHHSDADFDALSAVSGPASAAVAEDTARLQLELPGAEQIRSAVGWQQAREAFDSWDAARQRHGLQQAGALPGLLRQLGLSGDDPRQRAACAELIASARKRLLDYRGFRAWWFLACLPTLAAARSPDPSGASAAGASRHDPYGERAGGGGRDAAGGGADPDAFALVPYTGPPPAGWVLTVQFKFGRQGEFASEASVPSGTHLVVQADRGEDLGMVVESRPATPADLRGGRVQRVLRQASDSEAAYWRGALAQQELAAREQAQDIIERHGVPMTIVHAEFQFDGRKLTLHFTSRESHPDFREALCECYATWQCRIWFARYSRLGQDIACRRSLGSGAAEPSVPLICGPPPDPPSTEQSAPVHPPPDGAEGSPLLCSAAPAPQGDAPPRVVRIIVAHPAMCLPDGRPPVSPPPQPEYSLLNSVD
eukprot:TRINITY_DN24964_c0_g1_i1.p1 TRINITY_DN24964_c0_g1~~TRINITY_DN24964_c0_g1_i1.p1  ORF type:complete len:506 (+),score=136.92 TRINITY_DN24964_c0_g1_i1:125-1642(+)